MKRYRLAGAMILALCTLARAEMHPNDMFDHIDAFLKSAVADDGVRYARIQDEEATLLNLVTELSSLRIEQIEDLNTRKAFWINAYNIVAISDIMAHYPVESPQRISGFFSDIQHTIAGEKITLDGIEKEKLTADFQDPRIHFAIVCAAAGCPSIVQDVYRPEKLDMQLDTRVRETVNTTKHVRVDHDFKTVHLSAIFDWYADEFSRDHGSVLDYINTYRGERIPTHYDIKYMPYDWSLNEVRSPDANRTMGTPDLRALTPSALLAPGRYEVKEFLNLYTQTAYYDESGSRIELDDRSTYLTIITQFLYGVTHRVSAGIDIYLKSVLNADADDSPFDILGFPSKESARTALTSIGPKIKVSPFRSLASFSFQTMILIPLHDDLEGGNSGGQFLDYDGLQWWTQLFYDRLLNDRLLLYAEGDVFWRPDGAEDLSTPLKLIVNYYPHDRWTVYALNEFAPSWNGFDWDAYYGQMGLGAKWQITESWELESSWTIFPFGENKGAGTTLNLGVRVVG